MSELRSAYEDAEARVIESAKAAVRDARRRVEAFDDLLAAARALVMAEDAWTHAMTADGIDLDEYQQCREAWGAAFDALRAAVEAAGE